MTFIHPAQLTVGRIRGKIDDAIKSFQTGPGELYPLRENETVRYHVDQTGLDALERLVAEVDQYIFSSRFAPNEIGRFRAVADLLKELEAAREVLNSVSQSEISDDV